MKRYYYNVGKQSILLILLNVLIFVRVGAFFPNVYPRLNIDSTNSNAVGNPLLLTAYLKMGAIPLAQNISRVSLTDALGFQSHAGFFTINESYNSNLFFWYFLPISKNKTAPVVLWLQGGPGGSSLFGLFMEIGPLIVRKESIALRKYHWALEYHLIFIDNPVGTGFSFTMNDKGYCNDNACVAKGLYICLNQFFDLFPDLRKNELYLAGESYAGKYLPGLAMVIHQENLNSNLKTNMNLKGIAMGNPYCDPINQLDYGNYLYQHGLLDDVQRNFFLRYQVQIVNAIKNEKWMEADNLLDRLIDGRMNDSYFFSYTGFEFYYDITEAKSNINPDIFTNLLQRDNVRKAIHVGGRPFSNGSVVQLHLHLDILKSVAPIISDLLSHYRIMFYSGQMDIIVAYPLTENVLRKLEFSSSKEYKTAVRHIWKVDGDIAGYWKNAGNLTEVLVRNSGHMVPMDQPKWALDMITKFISKEFMDKKNCSK